MRKPQSTREKLESLEAQRIEVKKKSQGMTPWLIAVPVLSFIVTLLLTRHPGIVMGITATAAIISTIIYGLTIDSDFDKLKYDVRRALVKEFMKTYHPETQYNYYATKQKVEEIVKRANLVNGVNRYNEEDVITGSHEGAYFYFSEIHLKRKKEKSTTTKFKGILFKIKLPGRNFPKSKIQSRQGIFSQLFGTFYHNEEFDLYINSENPQRLEEEIRPLLPFIAHLSNKQNDLRISTHGDEITILMNSNMRLLDDPRPHLDRSFLKEDYKDNVARQLNTLLFIVDSFINNADTSEIEERLELKSLAKIELNINRET